VHPNQVGPESSASLTGRIVLGRYRIVRPLARGGMGVVYLGRVEGDAGFSKPVVVKSVLSDFDEQEGERLFAREARIVANLQHPGIVAVIDFGKVGGAHVMVLEYVHGYNLGQWLRFVSQIRGSMPVQQAVHVVLCVLDALGFAHALARPDGTALGIVHRDISPANVLIDLQGHVKLSDFGIARMADDEFKTQRGLFRGTVLFSAPEALRGESTSPKVDQYACAVVLYQLLAGKNPFKGAEPSESVTRVLTHVPPPISTLRSDVPAALDAAISRALSKNPAKRFDSVGEFARAIRAGCTWPEREAAESFAAQIERDFSGTEMSEALGLEPLAIRDASWREAQEPSTHRVSLSSSPPGMRSGVLPQGSTLPELAAAVGAPAKAQAASQQDAAPAKKVWLWIVVAALVAGAGSAAVIALLTRPNQQSASRLLVIEKQAADPVPADPARADPAPPPADSATAAPVDTASAAPPQAAASAPGRAEGAAGVGRGALLGRAFQRQESKIQSCFQQHAASVQGEPRISVNFQIDAAGAVQNAIVSPSSVAGTALGQCLVGVARATSFGPQPEPISFSIPIAARVVRK